MGGRRILLLGASGYTGRLVASSLSRLGLAPVLVGREPRRLAALRDSLGAEAVLAADVRSPHSISAALSPGDVLVSTVGPFNALGAAARDAAIECRCDYVDCAGEAAFLRESVGECDAAAKEAGVSLLTGFGFDYFPGNVAGALALKRAGDAGTQLEIGYFALADHGLSRGTKLSFEQGVGQAFVARDDGLAPVDSGSLRFRVDGRVARASLIGATEPLFLPRLRPGLRVSVGLGKLRGVRPATRSPRPAAGELGLDPGDLGGPGPEQRAGSGVRVVARCLDAAGTPVSSVAMEGPNGYEVTADLMSWTAHRLLDGCRPLGASGPIDGFGLPAARDACQTAGLAEVEPDPGSNDSEPSRG